MYEYKAKVINVVDGDTVDCVIDVGFYMTATIRIRLAGIDTPEQNSELGRVAKTYLESRILGKEILLKTSKADSFGRWLGVIFLDDGEKEVNINNELVFKGLAVPYRR